MKYFILFLIFATFISGLVLVGFDTKVVGEIPCVDGLNRVNLEGIMCEDEETTWFGYHENYSYLMALIFLMVGLLALYLETRDKK